MEAKLIREQEKGLTTSYFLPAANQGSISHEDNRFKSQLPSSVKKHLWEKLSANPVHPLLGNALTENENNLKALVWKAFLKIFQISLFSCPKAEKECMRMENGSTCTHLY